VSTLRTPRPSPRAIALLVACASQVTHVEAVPADVQRPPDEWRVHGAVGAGGSLALTGHQDDRLRFDVVANLKLFSRVGALVAWRAADREHRGLVMAGLVYEGAAARPRLVLDLHVEIGVDLDAEAPVVGGGILTTLAIVGPLGIALDTGAYLVLDGIDETRLQIQSSALVVARW
jgi:hypothetical protein